MLPSASVQPPENGTGYRRPMRCTSPPDGREAREKGAERPLDDALMVEKENDPKRPQVRLERWFQEGLVVTPVKKGVRASTPTTASTASTDRSSAASTRPRTVVSPVQLAEQRAARDSQTPVQALYASHEVRLASAVAATQAAQAQAERWSWFSADAWGVSPPGAGPRGGGAARAHGDPGPGERRDAGAGEQRAHVRLELRAAAPHVRAVPVRRQQCAPVAAPVAALSRSDGHPDSGGQPAAGRTQAAAPGGHWHADDARPGPGRDADPLQQDCAAP